MNPLKLALTTRFPRRRRTTPVGILIVVVAAAALSGCVVGPPTGPVLSRLAPDQPGAASSARPLTEAEKKRYDEIDKQVLREQNEAMAADAWASYYTPYYAAPPVVYGGYGGYYYPPGWWW